MNLKDDSIAKRGARQLKPKKDGILKRLKQGTYAPSQHDESPISDANVKSISDEEAFQKGFDQNQGQFLVLGALYRRSVFSWLHNALFLLCSLILLAFLGQAAILFADDLTLLFETIHWMTIVGGTTSILPSFIANQFRLDRLFKIFGKNVYSYSTLDDETALAVQKLRAQSSKEKFFLSKAFTIMLLGTYAGFGLILPVMAMYTGTFFEPQRSNGIIMGIPCIIWFPIQIGDDWIVLFRVLVLAFEGYASFTVINFVIGQQTSAICVGHTLLYEFKILELTMNNFERRARLGCKKDASPTRRRRSESRIGEYLTSCLNDSIKHHEVLLEIVEDYTSIFYIPELVILISSTMVICLSAISLTSDIPLEAKAVSIVFTAAEMVNVFVNCYYGQVLLDAHNLLTTAIYGSNWINYSSYVRHHIIIIMERLHKPLSLSAGGFAEVNLDTFAQVVKSSFSYFSLLQALKE